MAGAGKVGGSEQAAIGVVVVNWNGHVHTIRCLESILSAPEAPERVVVVDNGSTDSSVQALLSWAEGRKLEVDIPGASRGDRGARLAILVADCNKGFAGGVNLGLGYLDLDPNLTHFLLLNNDTTVAADFFREARRALRLEDCPELMGFTIYQARSPSVVWYAGGRFALWRAVVTHKRDSVESDAPVPTEFVTGCAMLISRRLLSALGPLPECYSPGYMEDAEFSYRALKAGFRIGYLPTARVYHEGGVAARELGTDATLVQLFHRNRMFFARRNLKGRTLYSAFAYLLVGKLFHCALETLRGRPRRAYAIMRGVIRGLLSPLPAD